MIAVEKNERVLHLILDIPPVNVLDTANCEELAEKLKNASKDDTLAGVIISGEGKCFSAGASVEEHKKEKADRMIGSFVDVCRALYELPVPSITLVHGFCFGGALEIALYSDFIIADPSAKFAVPEIKLAFFPPFACSVLPRIVGRQNAAHMIFTGDTVDAERAHAMGLAQKIVIKDEWGEIVSQLNNTSTPVLRLAKEAFRLGLDTRTDEFYGPLVNDYFLGTLYTIKDVKEGIESFLEKRKPAWKHK